VTELEPDAGGGGGVHEVGDLAPGLALGVGPQAGAPGGDATGGGHAHHLGHDEPGTAQGLAAQVDEVERARQAVDGGVDVHRGDDHPVLQLELADPHRLEHRRDDLGQAVCPGEVGLDLGLSPVF